jgi:DNA helicase HerA-like ATPase
MPNGRDQDIAVVGSPSSNTELTVDLLQEATEERLVGALTAFRATQNGNPITSVGQIVGIELRNRWHEDSVFRNLVKRTGEIPPITNRQDTRTADLVVGATFKQGRDGFEPEVLGVVPPTGTRVFRVDQALLDQLLAVYRSEIVYVGRAYANDVFYPMWFKHFASGRGGAGEAYHIGVFGKTGSGKSGLAKMLLLAYARHPELGILIIDPQGEFSYELQGQRVGEQGLPVDTVLGRLGRQILRYSIADIQLDQWDMFEDLLVDLNFLERLGIRHPDNARIAADLGRSDLQRSRVTLEDLESERVLRQVLGIIDTRADRIYTTPGYPQRLRDRVNEILQNDLAQLYNETWQPLASMFAGGQGRRSLYGIVDDLVGSIGSGRTSRPVVLIDISERGNPRFWTEELQRRILARLLNVLYVRASQTINATQGVNVLVLLDEAHRHAPSGHLESGSQAEVLRSVLRRAVRETRKYGVGWFLISQTLGGIDNEILQQLRILFFGFGLALGDEFRKLGEYAGGDERAMELYKSFRDPHSAPRRDLREFPFMGVGPVSPLAFSGKPLFFSAFIDPQEFMRVNNLLGRQGSR